MLDFALTQKGDLKFTETEKPRPLKVSFNVAEFPSLKVGFITTGEPEMERPENGLIVSFDIDSVPGRVTRLETARGKGFFEQKIRVALFTEKGELPDRDLGSRLAELKHRRIDRKLLSEVKRAVEEALSDMEVEVEVTKQKGATTLYDHNLVVTIREGEEPIDIVV